MNPYEHPQLEDIQADIDAALAEVERLTALRDQLIRAELARGWRPVDLARAIGVGRSRIHQIKHEKGK